MRCALFLGALALVLAGCASSVTRASRPIHHDLSTLQWGVAGVPDVTTLDPALASDATSLSVAGLVYGGLVRLDSQLRVQPDGADRWQISPDGKVYTFHIRAGLRFADGTPVTADDFAAALDRALGPDGPSGAASFYLGLIVGADAAARGERSTVSGIEVINRSSLRITLVRPAAHFLSELAFPASFVPNPALYRRYGTYWSDHAAGFGPFTVKSWSRTRSLTLVRNPNYWGGRPTFKRIRLRFYPTEATAQSAFAHGDVDLVTGLPPGSPVAGSPKGLRYFPALALDYLAFNTTRKPFSSVAARKALAAVWRPAIARQSLGSGVVPVSGLPLPGLPAATGAWGSKVSPGGKLASAGYPGGKKFPRIVLFINGNAGLGALARSMARAWHARLHIHVRVRALNPTTYGHVLASREFDLAVVRWGGVYPDPQDFLQSQLGPNSGNVTGWSASGFEHAVSLADSYSPADSRRAILFRQASVIASHDLPLVPLDRPAFPSLMRAQLRGISLTGLGTVSANWTTARYVVH